MTLLPYEEEVVLLDHLKKVLGMNVNNHNRPILWNSLSQMSPHLMIYDVETLHFYTSLLAAGGFFQDFVDRGDTFSLKKGTYDFISVPGTHRPPMYRRYRKMPLWKHIGSLLLAAAILYLFHHMLR